MDWDDRAEHAHRQQCYEWFRSFARCRTEMAAWVSLFHHGSSCELVDDRCGSFNWCCRFRFQDGTQWMVRFAVAGKAMDRDGKVRQEVATMRLLREKTTIPVPQVHGWGFSDVNPFGLGPFIIMDYIEGHPLGTLWEDPNQDRLLRPNIGEQDLRKVYRQISRHLLELSRLQFTKIGSLDIGDDGTPLVRRPPLTLKMQEIEAHGGVKVGDSKTPFSSWTEYFTYVADQDLKHLNEQPNSVDDAQDARDKFVFRRLFRDAIPSFVSNEHGKEGSRLLNDDFRFGNILVKSQTDLSIVAVLDWEWTYAAPYQLFYSPPRWLLMKKPIYLDESELSRYRHLFDIFLEELGSEEVESAKWNEQGNDTLSRLMRKSMDDGKFWFHELIHACFEDAGNSAWARLCKLRPEIKQTGGIRESEVIEFVSRKMRQLEAYKAETLDFQ